MLTSATVLSLCLVLSGGVADAHHVWIEQDARGARLYFGEFAENLRESSPGLLDKFGQPSARRLTARGAEPLTHTKGAEAFVLSARAGNGDSLVAEDTRYPSFEFKEGEKTLTGTWTPAARLITDFRARTPALTLDIVPTGKAGEAQVFFKNRPLAKAAVHVIAASGWGREMTTDDEGKFRFTTPWKGWYALEVHHDDSTPGKRAVAQGEEAYDKATYVTTLSFEQAGGLPSPPAPPRGTPGK